MRTLSDFARSCGKCLIGGRRKEIFMSPDEYLFLSGWRDGANAGETRVSLAAGEQTRGRHLSRIARYRDTTNVENNDAVHARIRRAMTNRASAEREPLIHQHQAGTRVHGARGHSVAVDRITFPPM